MKSGERRTRATPPDHSVGGIDASRKLHTLSVRRRRTPAHLDLGTIIGKLTTHVLDTVHGTPAAGMSLTLSRIDGKFVVSAKLGTNGRPVAPLLDGAAFIAGRYRLEFAVADYFRGLGVALADPPFLDRVPIEFAIADTASDYHVPLLVSPWSYATYRGS